MPRNLLLIGLLALPISVLPQGPQRANACFFSADLENGFPLAWDVGTFVERQTPDGDPLGEFVPAWTIGNAAQANANGFFPVPDVPLGNHFLMANDDAAPCNCDMGAVTMTTSAIDLSSRTNVWLECRLFNSELAGGDTATIEASTDGTVWDTVIVAPPLNAWTTYSADLSAYDGEATVYLRFGWSDGGTWAGGLAVDDLCLRERSVVDATVLKVEFGNSEVSPFNTNAQDLRYSALPLEQTGPIKVSVTLENRGITSLSMASVVVDLLLDGSVQGTWSGPFLGELLAGARTTVVVATGWQPTDVGELVAEARVDVALDEDMSDNSGTATMRITGPGWDDGYSAMARDAGLPDGTLGGNMGFIAVNRVEITNAGSTARGISTLIGGGSSVGEQVRAIVMDGNFAFIDTSYRHALTQADLDAASLGEPLYLPFSMQPQLTPSDLFVGIQHLGDAGTVNITTSGFGPVGGSAVMQGPLFDISWTASVPMVRLHLSDYGVGVPEAAANSINTLLAYPVPMDRNGTISFDVHDAGRSDLQVYDLTGRCHLAIDLGNMAIGKHQRNLDVSQLAAGTYVVKVRSAHGSITGRIVVAH